MLHTDRRGFLSALAAAAAAPAAGLAASSGETDLKLGVATYSLREFSRRLSIKMMREMKISYVSIKDFHLSYRGTPEETAKAAAEFQSAGITILSGGVIYMQRDDEAELRRMFEYARLAKMPMMIIAPSRESMPRIEKLVREFDIKVAIHNHGPEDKHFPGTKDGLAVIKNMDPRIGLCIDVGHEARTGAGVPASIAQAGSRLFDVHIKDIVETSGKNRGAVVGQGVLPIPAIFKELLKMKYQGGVMLEYEIDGDNPGPGMQSSFSYMRGVLAGLAAARA
jgi:sugar phosphate isomerase/epimerase